jgi:hypothetical protein
MRDIEGGREIAAAKDAGIITDDVVAAAAPRFRRQRAKRRELAGSKTAGCHQQPVQEISSRNLGGANTFRRSHVRARHSGSNRCSREHACSSAIPQEAGTREGGCTVMPLHCGEFCPGGHAATRPLTE